MSTPADALEVLRAGARSGALAAFCESERIDLLVAFGSAVRTPEKARDLDLGVLAPQRTGTDRLLMVSELTAYLHCDAVDVLDLDHAGVLARAEALGDGEPLYEARAGLFAQEQMRALGQRMDTTWLHALQLDLLDTA